MCELLNTVMTNIGCWPRLIYLFRINFIFVNVTVKLMCCVFCVCVCVCVRACVRACMCVSN